MSLRRWVTFLDTLEPLRYAGLFDARRAARYRRGTGRRRRRARSTAGSPTASVTERLRRHRARRASTRGAHEKAIRRFTAAVAGGARAPDARRCRRRCSAPRPFDAASGAGQVGALQRELAKQRRGLGVRALLAQYGELITAGHAVRAGVARTRWPGSSRRGAASSTWSSSTRRRRSGWPTRSGRWAGRGRPSSSATASRCRRRRSPSRPSGVDDDDDVAETAVEDEESILTECVQARVPRQWLSWHYRSQDESLIAFSNAPVLREPAVVVPGADARAGVVGAGRPRRLARAGARHVPPLRRRRGCCAPTRSRRRRSSRRSAAGSTRAQVGTARRRPVDRRRHLQRPAAGLHRGAAARRRRRPARRGARPHRRRGPVRQEPGERAGRRARRHPLLHRLLRQRQRRRCR